MMVSNGQRICTSIGLRTSENKMAARDTLVHSDNSLARDVQSLVQSVRALSDRITPRENPVNSEVSDVFGRRGTSQTTSSTSSNLVSILPATNTVISTGASTWSSSSSSRPGSAPSVNAVSRYRRINNSRRIGSKSKSKKPNRHDNKPFFCDILLLSGPNESSVPRQGTNFTLSERDHVITACRFNKSMNEIEVESIIHEAFDGIISPLVDIEILQSVHTV